MQTTAPTQRTTPEHVIEEYFAALNASDADRIASLFTDDAAVMPDSFPTAIGHEQILATYAGAFAATGFRRTVRIEQVAVSHETATVMTNSTGTTTLLHHGTEIPQTLRELFVLRDQPDGWGITHYMFNSPEAAEEHSAHRPHD
jgi:uncharacterized protein (TIGR02246 family)